MPDTGWIPAELVLPSEGREVLVYSHNNLGVRKGYQLEGIWYDLAHREIEADYWKPGLEKSEEG